MDCVRVSYTMTPLMTYMERSMCLPLESARCSVLYFDLTKQ